MATFYNKQIIQDQLIVDLITAQFDEKQYQITKNREIIFNFSTIARQNHKNQNKPIPIISNKIEPEDEEEEEIEVKIQKKATTLLHIMREKGINTDKIDFSDQSTIEVLKELLNEFYYSKTRITR